MLNIDMQKRSKGFTLSEIVVTMAVLAIFLAVVLPLFTVQKNFTGTDKDAADCVIKEGAASLTSTACATALSKCVRNKSNACNTLLNLASTYSDPSMTVLGEACNQGGKQACSLLINRCIDNSANCDVANETYDIHNYLAWKADNTGLTSAQVAAKDLMYNLLKEKMNLAVENIADRVIDDCRADSTSMACTLLGHKVYNFNQEDEYEFDEMNAEFGTIFRNGNAQLVKDTWANQYGLWTLETARDIVISGNYAYITGTGGGYNPLFMKVNISDGTVVWKKVFGTGWASCFRLVLGNNAIYAVGNEKFTSGYTNTNILVMKINQSDGSFVWSNRYGGAGNDGGPNMVNLSAIAISGSDLYITSMESSDSYGGSGDILVMRLNESDGSVVWKNQYGGTNYDTGTAIKVSGSYVYVAGETALDDPSCTYQFAMKLNTSDGTVVWKKVFGWEGWGSTPCYDMDVSDGYVYMVGLGAGSVGITVVKLQDANDSSGGSWVWGKHFQDGIGGCFGYWVGGLKVTVSGSNLYVIGTDNTSCSADASFGLLIKMGTDGSTKWARKFGGPRSTGFYSVAYASGYIYVAGSMVQTPGTSLLNDNRYVLLMKLNDNPGTNVTRWYVQGHDITSNWGSECFWDLISAAIPTGATGWTLEGNTIDTEAIRNSEWTYEGTTIDTEPITTATWVIATDDEFGWPLEGVTLDDEPVTDWETEYYYIATTDTNNIQDVKAKTVKATITQDLSETGSNILYLVSFDGRGTWCVWDGDSWETVDTSLGLNDYTVAASGNTAAELVDGFNNHAVPAGATSIDIVAFLSTGDTRHTPYLNTIDIWYY